MMRVVIGTVGFFFGLPEYPLGQILMERLQQASWPDWVTVQEMNWPPLLVVQDLQARQEEITRVVLVAGVHRGLRPGTLTSRRWLGGSRDAEEMQERMVQGMIGGVNLDNLLMIGEHFGAWPGELITVEVEITNNLYGAMAIAHGRRAAEQAPGVTLPERRPDPEVMHLIEHVFDRTRVAALTPMAALQDLVTLSADQITPLPVWVNSDFTDQDISQTKPDKGGY